MASLGGCHIGSYYWLEPWLVSLETFLITCQSAFQLSRSLTYRQNKVFVAFFPTPSAFPDIVGTPTTKLVPDLPAWHLHWLVVPAVLSREWNRGKLSLPIYHDSQEDDAVLYDDWHCEVDSLIQRGHSQHKIKMAVLDALEGRPKRTAQVADINWKGRIGQGKLYKILDVLENSYGRSITYQSLIGELCSICQKWGETPKSYYEQLMTIVLLLCKCHSECIKVKELDSMVKDCFYSGLHEQYQPLVIHLKDKAHMTASDLLKAIQVHEEAELTYKTEDIITPLIDPSMMHNTSLDKISSVRRLKVMLPKSPHCPTRNNQSRMNCQMPLMWTRITNWVTTKESYRQQTWMMIPADVSTVINWT